MENNFKIIVPVYNAERYIGKCLDSIQKQTYTNFKCVIINDASTDNTGKIALEKILIDDRFILIDNKIRKYCVENIVNGLNFICNNDEDIVVKVDGDDELFDENVLSYVNSIYEDSNVWMTYGQYMFVSNGVEGTCQYVPGLFNRKDIDRWLLSHLRTHKYFLFRLIKDEDLRDVEGKYFCFAEDRVFLYPMAEMAGGHLKFISKVLYKYNDMSPLNEFRTSVTKQLATDAYVRAKPSYKPLERKPDK